MSNQQYGLLATESIELPYKTKAAQKKAEKMNEELKGTGFRTCRLGQDWTYKKYGDIASNILKQDPAQTNIRAAHTKLQSGDLVKIFKTVSDGDVLWAGTIDYDRKEYHHGLQKKLDRKIWANMFYDQLPARLERDGKIMFGALEPFCETGTEGVIWALSEYGKSGYDGLVAVKDADKLTVYSTVRDGDVEWEGKLDFAPEKVSKVGWTEIMRKTKHMDTQKWLAMSWQRRPVIVTPK